MSNSSNESMVNPSGGLYLYHFFSSKFDLDEAILISAEDVFFPVDLTFGFFGERGGHNYDVFVATPQAMKKHSIFLGVRKVILVGDDPVGDMLASIHQTMLQCNSEDCLESFAKLAKFYNWEYENYQVTDD